MYQFLLDRCGPRIAYWGTAAWYFMLIALVLLSVSMPAGEFRYGNL